MRTDIARKLGCDVPIFAFSHCRDVVVEVTRAGGFGVLGASTFAPELLEQELCWIDAHVGGRPYGVDVLIPTTYDRDAEMAGAGGAPESMIPEAQRAFMEAILVEAGVGALPEDERARVHREIVEGRGNMTPDGARRLLAVALTHAQVKLVVSALGAPPPDVVADLRARGVMVGALCGKTSHAIRHRAAVTALDRGPHGVRPLLPVCPAEKSFHRLTVDTSRFRVGVHYPEIGIQGEERVPNRIESAHRRARLDFGPSPRTERRRRIRGSLVPPAAALVVAVE